MFKVLIVDDEPNICQLIKSQIDWDSLPVSFSGFAYDGEDAFTLIKKDTPDIVITDISMPSISGVDLVRMTVEEGLHVRFIVISGYSYFNFAYRSIKYGVDDYLLKPVNAQELNAALQTLAGKLQGEVTTAVTHAGSSPHLEKVRHSFLNDILFKRNSFANRSIEEINHTFLFHFLPGEFCMGILQVNGLYSLSASAQELLLNRLTKGLTSEMRKYANEFAAFDYKNSVVFVINYPDDRRKDISLAYRRSLTALSNLIASNIALSLTMGIGIPTSFIHELPESLSSAETALVVHVLRSDDPLIFAAALNLQDNAVVNATISSHQLNSIIGAIDRMDMKALRAAFTEVLDTLLSAAEAAPQKWISILSDNLLALLYELSKRDLLEGDVLSHVSSFRDMLTLCSNRREIRNSMCEKLCSLFDNAESAQNLMEQKRIRIAKEFIMQNYQRPLKLEDVAAKVYLNPHYFGILFKKEVGVNFGDFIISLRIEEAKRLLLDVDLSISEIVYRVGYNDVRYFGRLFKKQVGITPSKFRKLH